MITKEIPVNHDILAWAREEANLSPLNAVNKARIKDLKAKGCKEGIPATIRLERWEKGIEKPTFPQLEKLAKAYRRPVLTFFLTKRPIKQERLQDFRTIGNVAFNSELFSPEFSALIRQVEALQFNIHDLLLETGASRHLPYVESTAPDATPIQVALQIRSLLEYSFEDQRNTVNYDKVFSDIRNRAEQHGIFIILEGNLGSHHTNISPEVFRGLAISDKIAPFIVINPNDAKSARIFSLIHELSHIFLGETGISNMNSFDISSRTLAHENERFCDQVAAEFLVPQSELLREWAKLPISYSFEESISFISRQFSVSNIVIARRLLDFGRIDNKFYWDYFNACQDEWQQIRNNIAKKEVIIPYRIRTRSRLGNRLIDTVINATRDGRISELEASRMLNVKINNFDKIL